MATKYIRKDKLTDDISVMDISHSFLGVRTRAKTIALQKLHQQQSLTAEDASGSSGSYLQLRNRRLRKPPIHSTSGSSRRSKQLKRVDSSLCLRNRSVVADSGACSNPNSMAAMSRLDVRFFPSWSGGSVANSEVKIDASVAGAPAEVVAETQGNSNDVGIDNPFGENFLEIEGGERGSCRSMRETTPSSLIHEPNMVLTPGSVTRCTTARDGDTLEPPAASRYVPSLSEVDDFFSRTEEQQQKLFTDKYNFDPVKDKPLPGRFQWEKVGL